MAENSPSKRARASAPIGRPFGGKMKNSPTKMPPATRPLALATLNGNSNFFSFSGGSTSLFPMANPNSNGPSRPAMTELSNLIKENLKYNPPATSATTDQKQKDGSNEIGVIGGHRNVRRTSQGFIRVESSCKIMGEEKENKGHVLERNKSVAVTPSLILFEDMEIKSDDKAEINAKVKAKDVPSQECKSSLTLPPNVAQMFAPKVGSLPVPRGVLTERKDPLYDFPEYSLEIINYWMKYEKRSRPKRHYMLKQPEISYRMRTILVDWLVEVGIEYDMQGETIFSAVNCVDRFLSKMSVTRSKLQLIGTAALFICSKYEEIQPPGITDFVFITDETYTKEQVLQMETIMLTTLQFDLMAPTSFDFVRSFASILRLNSPTTSLAMYLTELSMLEGERYLLYLPSIIATAAIALSRYTFQNPFWDEKIAILTTHLLRDVQSCAQHLFNSFYEAPSSAQTAVYDKYKSVRYCSISQTILPARLPWEETGIRI